MWEFCRRSVTAFKSMHMRSTQSLSPCRTLGRKRYVLRRSAETELSKDSLALPLSGGLDNMKQSSAISTDSANSRNGTAALEQNRAAGGADQRRMLTRSDGTYRARLRFKSGGATVQRPVGKFAAPNRFQALKLAWSALKAEKIAEKEGWSWVVPDAPPVTVQKNLPAAP